MAAEASVADQTVEGHAEEIKMSDDVKSLNEESSSQPKDLGIKDEEAGKEKTGDNEVPASDVVADEPVDEKEIKSQPEVTITPEPIKEAVENPIENVASETLLATEPVASDIVTEEVKDKEVPPETATEEVKDTQIPPEAVTEEVKDAEIPPETVTKEVKDTEVTPETVTEEVKDTEVPPDVVMEEAKDAEIPPETVTEEVKDTEIPPETVTEEVKDTGVTPETFTEEVKDTGVTPETFTEEVKDTEIPPETVNEEVKDTEVSPETVTEEVKDAEVPPETVIEEVKDTEVPPETVSEEEIKMPVSSDAVEKPTENVESSLVQESDPVPSEEPVVSETVSQEVKSAEVLPELSSALETESPLGESPIVAVVTEPAPNTTATSDVIESAEFSQNEKRSPKELGLNPETSNGESIAVDLGKAEGISDNIRETVTSASSKVVAAVAAEVNEVKEIGEGAVISEVPDVQEKAEVDIEPNGGLDESVKENNGIEATNAGPVTEVEGIEKLEVMAEEDQEKVDVAEEPTGSETVENGGTAEVAGVLSEVSSSVEKVVDEKKDEILDDLGKALTGSDAPAKVAEVLSEGEKASESVEVAEEKKDGTLEDEKPTLSETSRDFDMEGGKNGFETSAKELVGDAKVVDPETKPDEVEPARDVGEAPKQEVPPKSSNRSSNNIISKVKHSLVKVKKAIIGKSPSSKTMSSEVKNELKVK